MLKQVQAVTNTPRLSKRFAEVTAEMAQEDVTVHRREAPWPRKAHLTRELEGKDASFLEIGRH